ncbi:MAG: hypothetical protein NVS2B16_36220 [Chloroflexota bacterium]
MDTMVKSFAQMVTDYLGIVDFDGDQYVAELSGSPMAKSLSLASSTASGGSGQPPYFNPTGAGGFPQYGNTYADATALRLQNMDSTLTSVLFQENHFVLFNWVNKIPTLGPLYEWNKRKGYGSSRSAPGFGEGGAPQASVGSYERDNAQVRFMGVRRGLTHQLAMTGQNGGTIIDPVAEENRNGTMALLEKIERQVIFGDSLITNVAGASVNYDGLIKQVVSVQPQNVIDMQGAPLYLEQFEDIGYRLFNDAYVKNFQNVRAFMAGSVIADLAKIRFPNERQEVTTKIPQSGFDTGFTLGGHVTNFGRIAFEPSVFLEEVQGSKPLGISEVASPTLATANAGFLVVTPEVDPNTIVSTKVPTGTYYYWFSAYNEAGESAAVAVGGNATPTAFAITATNTAVGLVLTPTGTFAAGINNGVVGWRIYRSTSATPFLNLGSSNVVTDPTCGLIAHIPHPGMTANTAGYYINGSQTGATATNYEMYLQATATTWVDRNQTVPRSALCLVLEKSEENLAIAQMTPLLKFPLAITSTTVEWLLLLYHVFVVKAPERQFVIKNIGRLT